MTSETHYELNSASTMRTQVLPILRLGLNVNYHNDGWSPEMELLDQLTGGDETLHFALRVFGWPSKPQCLKRVQHAVTQQVSEGLLVLRQKDDRGWRVLPEWEALEVHRSDSNWLNEDRNSPNFVSLRPKGSKNIG